MARNVRLSDIAAYRARDRERGRTRRAWWRQLVASPIERVALLIAFSAMVYVGAIVLPDGMVDAFLPSETGAVPVYSAQFAECSGPARITCVVDGDTIWLDGTKIRIADIDTPEVTSPNCAHELVLGNKATDRLTELLNDGPFALEPYGRDKDVYGRDLRIITRDGISLGKVLVSEGLAHDWDGRRHSWCG